MRKVFLLAYVVCALPLLAQAQFNSGSTGADGALDLSTCPTAICEVQLPESGRLDYTTVNVPQGKTLIFNLNSRNTPVILLAQGNVVINGQINVSVPSTYTPFINDAFFRNPGPGGFYGGYGPGAGQPPPGNPAARWVGSLSLVPIIGGSGSYTGCGGGGAIVIASSTNISITGGLFANAHPSGSFCSPNAGSGGAIRLISNLITISGNLLALGGNSNNGVIRLEAPQGQINMTGTATPTPVFAQINPVIILTNPPTLRIASIGGYAVPSYSVGRPDRIDLLLPTQLPDPIQVQIQGSNVPSGTQVQIQLSGSPGTASDCTLTGGPGPVACNASVSGLNRSGVSTLLAVAIFTPPPIAEAFNPKGQNYVAKVKLETALGGKPKYVFLRADGTKVEIKSLSTQFLQQFGM